MTAPTGLATNRRYYQIGVLARGRRFDKICVNYKLELSYGEGKVYPRKIEASQFVLLCALAVLTVTAIFHELTENECLD